MKILEDIISRLEGFDKDAEYFDYDLVQREFLANVLWDEVYGDYYIETLKGMTLENPLTAQLNILDYLMEILNDYEINGEYELCDLVLNLILITENKIQEIDENYASSKQKTK